MQKLFFYLITSMLLILSCNRKEKPYTVYDANGNPKKQIYGEMDSIVYFKKDTVLTFKKEKEGRYKAQIFYKNKLVSKGSGTLKGNQFAKEGWWDEFFGDTIYRKEFMMVDNKEYVNQIKAYHNGKLLRDKSLFYEIQLIEDNQDSIVLELNLYVPEDETRLNSLCVTENIDDDLGNLNKIKIDTIPQLYENPVWKMVFIKSNYKKDSFKGFFHSVKYTEQEISNNNVVIREGTNHFFEVKL